jgi:hypothetical protein
MIRKIDGLSPNLGKSGDFAMLRLKLSNWLAEIEKELRESPEPSCLSNKNQQRRFIYGLCDTERAVRAAERNIPAFKHTSGLHLRGFYSNIDGSLQCYRVFVPASYSEHGPRLPLAVITPTLTTVPRPFIESPFIKDHDLADCMSAMAERHGVILLWSGYRNQPCGLPAEPAHLGEVLAAASLDYNYDSSRVVLLGPCSGAALAFDAAEAWPGRFAGLGFLDPEFVVRKNMPKETVSFFLGDPGFRKWFVGKAGADAFLVRKTPPVFIVNDGGYSGHGHPEVSEKFMLEAAKAAAPVELALRAQTALRHLDGWDELIGWATRQRLTSEDRKSVV